MSDALIRRRLAELERCESAGGREDLGGFSIEGTRLLERAVRAGASLRCVVMSEAFAASDDERLRHLLQELQELPDLELWTVPEARMRPLLGKRSFGEVLALVEFPRAVSLAECLASASKSPRGGLLCLVDANNPGNVGALVRTALVSGVNALIAVGLTDPFHPKAVRTSMGSLFRMPVLRYATIEELLADLQNAQVLKLALVAHEGLAPKDVPACQDPKVIFLGSEAFGLPEDICARLDQRVTIPMAPGVDSYSINAAASIALYELLVR